MIPASERARSKVRMPAGESAPTTCASGKWIAPKPISRCGDKTARSAHCLVVLSSARAVRSPAACAISAASSDISWASLRYASALRRSTLRGCSGTNWRALSRTSATGPSARSRIRTALVMTASISLSRAKISERAAWAVERGPLPATRCETHSMAWSANKSRVRLKISRAASKRCAAIACDTGDSGP